MSSVKHLLALAIKNALIAECITAITDEDTKVDEIVLRKFNGTARLVLVVQHFHPIEEAGWSDTIVGALNSQASDGFKGWPTMDSSGSTNQKIRGSIMLSGNLVSTGETSEEADRIIQEVVSRVKWTLKKYRDTFIGIPADSYGEKIVDFMDVASSEYDSGADTANTSRVFVKWVAMTHQQGVRT